MRLQIITVATCFVYGALANLAEAHNQKISAREVKYKSFKQCVSHCYDTTYFGMEIPPTPFDFVALHRGDADRIYFHILCNDRCAHMMDAQRETADMEWEEEREAERQAKRKAQRKAQRKA